MKRCKKVVFNYRDVLLQPENYSTEQSAISENGLPCLQPIYMRSGALHCIILLIH